MSDFTQFSLAVPPRRAPRWQEEADRLRVENPGEWARIHEFDKIEHAHQTVARINQGRYQAFRPQGHWESVSREGALYVRYIGPVDTASG